MLEQPDRISLYIVHTDQPNDRFEEWCSRRNKGSLSVTLSARNTAAPSHFGGLLAGVISASFLCRLGFPVDAPAPEFILQFWKEFKRPIPKIGATRSTAGAAAFRASAHPKRMPALSPSRFKSLSSCGQIPECPNDAFQLLMSCAQATARRDAGRGRVRSAVTRMARA